MPVGTIAESATPAGQIAEQPTGVQTYEAPRVPGFYAPPWQVVPLETAFVAEAYALTIISAASLPGVQPLAYQPAAHEPKTDTELEKQVSAILRGRPLDPYSAEIVAVAGEYGVDPLLIASIAIWERGGGEHACGFNGWGLGSCGPNLAAR